MLFKMCAKFAASLYMGQNFLDIWHVLYVKVPEVNYNQCGDK